MGLSVDEMLALEAAEAEADAAGESSTKAFTEAFQRFDVDGSGDLSPAELRQVLLSLEHEQQLPAEEVERLIAEADADGDGRVDYHEFAAMMQARQRLLFMADKLGQIKGELPSGRLPEGPDENMRRALSLAPLKVAKGQRGNGGKRRLRRRRKKRRWKGKAKGGFAARELRREKRECEWALAELDTKLQRDVQWVQEHCNVTSLRAQLYCKKWGMQKLQALMKRLEYKEVIAAWGLWRAAVLRLRHQEQAQLYMKFKGSRRLTALFANWKKKRVLAGWNSWTAIRLHQRRLEAEAAARQLQRFIRGHIGRTAARHRRSSSAAVQIQAAWRGRFARVETGRLKERQRLEEAAVFIQRAYRGYAGKQLGKVLLRSMRESQASVTIQRHVRGWQTRSVFLRYRSAVRIQAVWRGYLEREIIAGVRQAVAENVAAMRIQACFRGYHGRQIGLDLLETRMQVRLIWILNIALHICIYTWCNDCVFVRLCFWSLPKEFSKTMLYSSIPSLLELRCLSPL